VFCTVAVASLVARIRGSHDLRFLERM